GGNNMPTIKRKEEMNLTQLIEWGWKNKIKNLAFYSNKDGGSVYFNKDGVVYDEHEIAKIETFTVETEEEITEDTQIETLLEVTGHQTLNIRVNRSIKEI